MHRPRFPAAILVPLLALCVPASARATVITFDVANISGGGARWQYTYVVSGRVFQDDQGFVVYFDHSLYDNLSVGVANPPDWDALVEQPIAALLSPGFYDALALVDDPSLLGPFEVSFDWLGAGAPGSQPFEVYELLSGTLTPRAIESGRTRPAAVPEPSFLLLTTIGGVALSIRRARRPMRR
jgi:hypothetical protein